MSAEYEKIVPKVGSTVRKRNSHKYGDAVDADEIVTVSYFEDQISTEGKSGLHVHVYSRWYIKIDELRSEYNIRKASQKEKGTKCM